MSGRDAIRWAWQAGSGGVQLSGDFKTGARAEYGRGGRDPLPNLIQWIADGLIDTISGDDVPFLASLVERARKEG